MHSATVNAHRDAEAAPSGPGGPSAFPGAASPLGTATGAAVVLAAEDLRKVYGRGVVALDGVSLAVRRGDFIVVLGPSGAGKSTLLRCLNRLAVPTAGRVLFHGRDVTRARGAGLRRLRQGAGMVFQQFNLVGRLSVLENVLAGRLRFARSPLAFAGSHVGVAGRAARRAAMDALASVGLAHKARERADALSGGQQQRVAIARLLAQEPEVVLADEPIASLDPASADGVMDLLSKIRAERGIAVVANLHQPEVARRYASRVVGMRAGRVVFEGPPGEIDAGVERTLYGPHAATA